MNLEFIIVNREWLKAEARIQERQGKSKKGKLGRQFSLVAEGVVEKTKPIWQSPRLM